MDDGAPMVSISNGDPSPATEGTDPSITFTVELSNAADHALTVNYSTTNGTALAGEDYVADSGTLTFAAGETSKEITITVMDDSVFENPEAFTVDLSTPLVGLTIDDDSGTGAIISDDLPHLLTGTLITNTNNQTQVLRMTLEGPDPNDPAVNHTFSTFITLESEGQQASIFTQFALNTGFDISPNVEYTASLQWVSGPKVKVTNFELEGVTLISKTTGLNYKVSNSSSQMLEAKFEPAIDGVSVGKFISLTKITNTDTVGTKPKGHNDGIDTLDGTVGDDVIAGLGANDILSGGDGNDVLYGGKGGDEIDGGDGEDTVTYFKSTDPVYINLSDTDVTLPPEVGGRTVLAGAHGGNAEGDTLTNIENVVGSEKGDDILVANGDSTLIGLSGDDILVGGDSNDVLIGGYGEDTLYGGAGDDIMAGNSDPDVMTGGTGNDIFLYHHFDDAGDTITDYNQNNPGIENDIIDIAQLLVGFTTDPTAIDQFVQLEDQGDGNTMLSVLNPKDSSFVDMGLLEGVVAGDMVTLVIDELGTEATMEVIL